MDLQTLYDLTRVVVSVLALWLGTLVVLIAVWRYQRKRAGKPPLAAPAHVTVDISYAVALYLMALMRFLDVGDPPGVATPLSVLVIVTGLYGVAYKGTRRPKG